MLPYVRMYCKYDCTIISVCGPAPCPKLVAEGTAGEHIPFTKQAVCMYVC